MTDKLRFDAQRIATSVKTIEDNQGVVIDPESASDPFDYIPAPTGIYIRTEDPNTSRVKTGDIYYLTSDSLLSWLKSRGGDNQWAEDVVGILMGHGHLHGPEEIEKK